LIGLPQHLYACGITYRSQAVAVQQVETVAVTPVAMATFVPVVVAVPQYSVSYVGPNAYAAPAASASSAQATTPAQPPVVQAQPPPTAQTTTPPAAPAQPKATAVDPQVQALQEENNRLRKELEDCRKQLKQPMPQAQPEAAAPPVAPPPHLAILTARCAVCHEAKVAPTKGRGVVLLEGDRLASLDNRQLNRILTQVYSGKMPKGGPALSDTEVAQLVTWMDSLK
ncbi:MAG: cytochrome c, partial [Planctomycetes bacterium]|nr:cytochrome c [Planctomycetota bacterium]